jgi:hypothetical protein
MGTMFSEPYTTLGSIRGDRNPYDVVGSASLPGRREGGFVREIRLEYGPGVPRSIIDIRVGVGIVIIEYTLPRVPYMGSYIVEYEGPAAGGVLIAADYRRDPDGGPEDDVLIWSVREPRLDLALPKMLTIIDSLCRTFSDLGLHLTPCQMTISHESSSAKTKNAKQESHRAAQPSVHAGSMVPRKRGFDKEEPQNNVNARARRKRTLIDQSNRNFQETMNKHRKLVRATKNKLPVCKDIAYTIFYPDELEQGAVARRISEYLLTDMDICDYNESILEIMRRYKSLWQRRPNSRPRNILKNPFLVIGTVPGGVAVSAALCKLSDDAPGKNASQLVVDRLCSAKTCKGAGTGIMKYIEDHVRRSMTSVKKITLNSVRESTGFYNKIGYTPVVSKKNRDAILLGSVVRDNVHPNIVRAIRVGLVPYHKSLAS